MFDGSSVNWIEENSSAEKMVANEIGRGNTGNAVLHLAISNVSSTVYSDFEQVSPFC